MNIKELLKKYWFLLLIVLCSVAFVIVYSVNSYQNREITVNAKKVDGQYILYQVDDEYLTADELYEIMANLTNSNYGVTQKQLYTANSLVKEVANAAIETTSDMSTYAANYASYIIQYYDESELDSQLKSLGYTNGYDDLSTYIIDMLKQSEMISNYYKDNYETLVKPVAEDQNAKLVYHILITVEDIESVTDDDGNTTYTANMTEVEQAKLDTVLSALESDTFENVAMNYSDDSSASSGGYLGVVTTTSVEDYVENFKNKVNEMEPGEVSDPVLTEYGYHIIKVEEADEDSVIADSDFLSLLSETYTNIEFVIINEKMNELGFTIVDEDFKTYFEEVVAQANETIANYGETEEAE